MPFSGQGFIYDCAILIIPKMKYTLALTAVLAAVTVICESSVIKAEPRSDLNIGFVTTGDRLLYRGYVYRAPNPNTIQYEDVVWRGNTTTNISTIFAREVVPMQATIPWITSGGLGQNHVIIQFHSFAGLGYNYQLDIYGR